MTTYPRDRFGYSSPFTRPPLKLPGKGRIIVWSVVNIEEWEITRPMARQLSIAPQGQSAIPDMPNWTWYEYGMRVGFWRLMRALKKAKVTPTMSLNAKVCETYPEATAAARDAGWEFMAHSYVQMPIQQIADKQREVMDQSIDILKKFTGTDADRLARARPRPDVRHARSCDRRRLHLVRRLGAGRPADLGEDRERSDPGDPLLGRDQRHHHDGVASSRVRRAARSHQGRVRPALSGEQGVDAHPRHRGASLRHRSGASHQVFRAALRLHQQASGRGALDRAADLRLVCEAGAEAEGSETHDNKSALGW